jgi:plastocyanin
VKFRAAALAASLLLVGAACGGDADDQASVSQVDSDAPPSLDDSTGWRENDLPGLAAALGGQEATYEFVIPPGASDALAAGEPLRIVPAYFEAKVGESVRIVNNDRRGHNVGPWYVGSNETLRQKFTSPGIYEGLCSVHPSGAMVLEVTDA